MTNLHITIQEHAYYQHNLVEQVPHISLLTTVKFYVDVIATCMVIYVQHQNSIAFSFQVVVIMANFNKQPFWTLNNCDIRGPSLSQG